MIYDFLESFKLDIRSYQNCHHNCSKQLFVQYRSVEDLRKCFYQTQLISLSLFMVLSSLHAVFFCMLFCPMQIFSLKLKFSEKSFRSTIKVSNIFDPVQAQRFVGPDDSLGLIWVQNVCKGYLQMALADKELILLMCIKLVYCI